MASPVLADLLEADDVVKRAKGMNAAQVVVWGQDGKMRTLSVPKTNNVNAIKREVASSAPVRVWFLDDQNKRLDELATLAAAHETERLAQTNVNLLTLRESMGLYQAQGELLLDGFVKSMNPIMRFAEASGRSTAKALEVLETALSQAVERAEAAEDEVRRLQDLCGEAADTIASLEQEMAVQEAKDASESRQEDMFREKAGEAFTELLDLLKSAKAAKDD